MILLISNVVLGWINSSDHSPGYFCGAGYILFVIKIEIGIVIVIFSLYKLA